MSNINDKNTTDNKEEEIIDYLWTRFEKAIDEQFLGDGTLPHPEHPLSQALSLFWQCASNPRVQALNLLATHSLLNTLDCCTEINDQGVVITVPSVATWFELRIILSGEKISVVVVGDERVVFSEWLLFNQRKCSGQVILYKI